MMEARPHLLRDERGTTLLEVIVAAVVLVIIAGAITSMVNAAQTGSGQQRVQAIAADLAQSTLEDLRGRKFQSLLNLDATTSVETGGVKFNVRSQSEWDMQATVGANGCDQSAKQPEALKVSATVTWENMQRAPVSVDTLVAVPVGTSDDKGNYVVHIANSSGGGVSGVVVTLGSQTGTTDADGCVKFAGVPEGTYPLSFSRPGFTTPEGQNVVTVPEVDVVAGQTRTSAFEYDQAGAAAIRFVPATTAFTPIASAAMPGATFRSSYGDIDFAAAPAGTRVLDVDQPNLYPFTTAYQVFPECDTALASPDGVLVPRGAATTPRQNVRVPVLVFELTRTPNGAQIRGEATSPCGGATGIKYTIPASPGNGSDETRAIPMPGGTLASACVSYVQSGSTYHRRWTNVALTYPSTTLSQDGRTNRMNSGPCPA